MTEVEIVRAALADYFGRQSNGGNAFYAPEEPSEEDFEGNLARYDGKIDMAALAHSIIAALDAARGEA